MLDSELFMNEDHFYQRMEASRAGNQEIEDEVVTFGERSVIVHKDKP